MRNVLLIFALLIGGQITARAQGVTVTAGAVKGSATQPTGACSPSGASAVAARHYNGTDYRCVSGTWTAIGATGAITPLSITITGTGGNGFVSLLEQSSPPSQPTNALRLYTTASNVFVWKDESNVVRTVAPLESPNFITPVLGVASATSINKVALTAPAMGATLTILDGKTATFNHSITFAGTDGTTQTFPSVSASIPGLAVANVFTALQTIDRAGIATTRTDSILLTNSTAATGGATVQQSPALVFLSRAWDSNDSVSRTQEYFFINVPTSSATPTAELALYNSDDGGANTKLGGFTKSGATGGLQINLTSTATALIASNSFRGFSAGGGVVIDNNSSTSGSHTIMRATATGTTGFLRFDPSGATERMRLDGSGNLLLGTTTTAATAAGTLHILDGTAPTASLANGVVIYSAAGEANVRDAAGNVTPFSPHHFAGIPGGASEPLAWSFHSERNGVTISVDMLRVVRLLEHLSAQRLIFIRDAATGELLDTAEYLKRFAK